MRLEPSRPTGRHVDFAIHSNNTKIDHRKQWRASLTSPAFSTTRRSSTTTEVKKLDAKGATKLQQRGTVLGRTLWKAVMLPPHLLQKMRRTCCRAKHRHPAPHAVQVLQGAAKMQLRSGEQKRVDTWTLNMEADLTKVRRWVKQADAGEETLNQLPLSVVCSVLSKLWKPRGEIPTNSWRI